MYVLVCVCANNTTTIVQKLVFVGSIWNFKFLSLSFYTIFQSLTPFSLTFGTLNVCPNSLEVTLLGLVHQILS